MNEDRQQAPIKLSQEECQILENDYLKLHLLRQEAQQLQQSIAKAEERVLNRLSHYVQNPQEVFPQFQGYSLTAINTFEDNILPTNTSSKKNKKKG